METKSIELYELFETCVARLQSLSHRKIEKFEKTNMYLIRSYEIPVPDTQFNTVGDEMIRKVVQEKRQSEILIKTAC